MIKNTTLKIYISNGKLENELSSLEYFNKQVKRKIKIFTAEFGSFEEKIKKKSISISPQSATELFLLSISCPNT